jgi:uncharacterized protein YbaR (Trm112 family)
MGIMLGEPANWKSYNGQMTASTRGTPVARLKIAHLALLSCPVCHGSLSMEETAITRHILCQVCGRCYPIADGLPILLADRSFTGQSFPDLAHP